MNLLDNSQTKYIYLLLLVLTTAFLIVGFFMLWQDLRLPQIEQGFPREIQKDKTSISLVNECLDVNFSQEEGVSQDEETWQVSFAIRLQNRTFVPKNNWREGLGCFSYLEEDEKYYGLVQLLINPGDQTKARLAASGIFLLDYVHDNAWAALFSKALNYNEIANLNGTVRWVGAFLAQDKIDIRLADKLTSSADQRAVVNVSFFPDPEKDGEAIEKTIAAAEGEIVSINKDSHSYLIDLPAKRLLDLAASNIVAYIWHQDLPPAGDLIRIEEPTFGALIESPLTIRGKARGFWFFEADFPLELVDGSGNILASNYAQAQGEWMTENFVAFKAEIEFENPQTKTGTLVLRKANPSGLPENDDKIEIPVAFSR